MDSHDRSGVPVPRLATIVALLVAAAVGAWVWQQWQRDAVRQALFDPDAPSVERIQSVEFWAAQGAPAVPELIRGLTHEDAKVREHTLMTLARMNMEAKAAVPSVVARLDDPDGNVREAAAAALSQIDPALPTRAPQLAQALKRERVARVRTALVNALVQIGPPALPSVLALTDTEEPDLRLELIRLLQTVGQGDRRALEVLRAYSVDPRGEVRQAALQARSGELALEEALGAIRDDEPNVVLIGLGRLSELARQRPLSPEDASCAVPAVVALLPADAASGRASLRDAAIAALEAIGPPTRSAAAALSRVLCDETGRPRMNVVRALISIEADQKIVLAALRDEILDRGNDGDFAAAELLWEYSPDAAQALVPELIAQLDSDDPDTQVGAAAALYAVAPAAADRVNELIAVLKRPESRTQWPLVAALERIGPEARDAVPVLIERIERRLSGRTPSRQASSELDALGAIGVGSEEVLALLRRAASDENAHNRCSAIGSMGRIPFAPQQILDALTQAMSDPEPNVRAAAAMAFGMIRPEREDAVAALRALLADENLYVRKAAVEALGRLGPEARPALPDLRAMVQVASGESASARGLVSSNEPPGWYPDSLFETYTRKLDELLAQAIARIKSDSARP